METPQNENKNGKSGPSVMASSVSGQGEPNPVIVIVIGYPSGQDDANFPDRDYALCPARNVFGLYPI